MLFYQQIANIISARESIVARPHIRLTSPVSQSPFCLLLYLFNTMQFVSPGNITEESQNTQKDDDLVNTARIVYSHKGIAFWDPFKAISKVIIEHKEWFSSITIPESLILIWFPIFPLLSFSIVLSNFLLEHFFALCILSSYDWDINVEFKNCVNDLTAG